MQKASWMVLAGLLACGDGTIGRESCVGVDCGSVVFQVDPLVVNFQEVSIKDPSPLPAPTWSIANPCVEACAQGDRGVLFPAVGEQSWNVVRGAPVPTLELIEGDGRRASQTLVRPVGAAGRYGTYIAPQSDGSLLVHAQWDGSPSGGAIDELTTVGSGLPPRSTTLRPLSQSRPLGVIRGEADAFLMFDADLLTGPLTGSVRLVGPDGTLLWQRSNTSSLPDDVAVVGGSAVWTSSQYVVTGRNTSAPGTTEYSLVWFNPGGVPERATRIFGATWRGAQLYDRGQGQFVAVAPSDLVTGGMSAGEYDGNIDIVEFNFETPVRGYRIVRDCLFKLVLHGFAIDRAGTMFVSTMVGSREEPRGLLCRLPNGSAPKCFQTEPNRTLGALVAVGSNSVVAVLDEQIVRFDLP